MQVAQQRKKILHMIGGGEIGGAEELILTLIKLTDPSRYEVHLICLCQGPFADLVRREGFPTSIIPMRNKMDLSKIGAVRRYIREQQIDLVHTHGVRANLIGRPAAKREGILVVTTFHSMLRYDYDHPWKAAVARFFTMQTNHYTDRFIAISHAIQEDLLDMHIPADKIDVIHNGLDVSKFSSRQNPEKTREQFGLASDRITFTMVARLHPVKGHGYFLEAARQLLDAGIEAQFLLIGEGMDRQELEAQIRDLGLDSVVHMPGYYRQVEEIYGISDVLCVPSLMEGLGLVILEGMYFGVPVIASRVGGIPELVEEGKSGILIPPADAQALFEAMHQLVVNPDLAQTLAQQGKERVQHFTVEKMAYQVEACYDDLLKEIPKRTQGKRSQLLIVLSGYYGFDNAGDEALLSAICYSIRRLEPRAEFVVLSGCPNKTETLHQLPAVDRMSPFQVLKVLRNADLLISGGGSLFQDVTGPRSLPYYISIVALAKTLGKPVIFYAQGVGPIQRRFSKFLMRWWGNKVELITLRDNSSRQLLRELGVVRPPTYVTADPVFTLDPSEEHYVRMAVLLERYHLKPGKLLGISVRPWAALADMRTDLARLLDTMVQQGYQVVFLPMDYSHDLPESHLIASMMREPATVLEETLSSMEMIALMANLEMVIGMRLHSLIFAASRGISFAGISYDPKIDAFLESFGLKPLNGSFEKMYEAVNLLLQDENRQAQIRHHAEELRVRAEENAKMALSLISSGL